MTTATHRLATVDRRPYFEKALTHGVSQRLIDPIKCDTIVADGAKGTVQVAQYFGTSHLFASLDNARKRIVHLVSLYLEHQCGEDLAKAAQSLQENSFLSHSRGGNDLLKALHAMPESAVFDGGAQGQALKEFQDERTLAKPMSHAAYRKELARRDLNQRMLAAASWFAQDMRVSASALDSVAAEAVIRTALPERLQEEAAQLFPQARTMVLSSDLITSIETMRSELNEIAAGRVDIIIGTQLVAKGHNFPRLNLVGVIDADLGLSNGDPRAAERTFQLLNQVIGRAGRDQGRGVGYLQTHQPDHPVMKALVACDREAFYASEIDMRERTGYPPFGRLASLIISAGDRPTAEGFARKLAAIAPIDARIQVLGPAEAPLAVIKGRYRFRLLIKSLRNVDLSEYLREWLAAAPKTKGNLKLEVDVDPQSFL